MSLSREDILNANDVVIEKVPVPEWGGDVYLRVMNGYERDDFEAELLARKESGQSNDTKEVLSLLLVKTICDEKGNRIFKDEDSSLLNKKSAKVLMQLFEVAKRLNGLGEDVIEELKQNFTEVQNDGSGSN